MSYVLAAVTKNEKRQRGAIRGESLDRQGTCHVERLQRFPMTQLGAFPLRISLTRRQGTMERQGIRTAADP